MVTTKIGHKIPNMAFIDLEKVEAGCMVYDKTIWRSRTRKLTNIDRIMGLRMMTREGRGSLISRHWECVIDTLKSVGLYNTEMSEQ